MMVMGWVTRWDGVGKVYVLMGAGYGVRGHQDIVFVIFKDVPNNSKITAHSVRGPTLDCVQLSGNPRDIT